MESNYQTINQNIFETAIDLADNKKYSELEPTDSYTICDYLVVNHVKKQFFFTKKGTVGHLQKLINSINTNNNERSKIN